MNARCYVLLASAVILLHFPSITFASQVKTTGKASRTTATQKAATENTCDGALDIVPSQPVSFARKRRPAPMRETPQEKPEKKANANVPSQL